MSDEIDWATISTETTSLLDEILKTRDVGMAAAFVNQTPFEWKQVANFGSPLELSQTEGGYLSGIASALGGWVVKTNPWIGFLALITPNTSDPVWSVAPDPVVPAYDSTKTDAEQAQQFALGGTVHTARVSGFEVAIPYHCSDINMYLVLFMVMLSGGGHDVPFAGALCISDTETFVVPFFNMKTPAFKLMMSSQTDRGLMDVVYAFLKLATSAGQAQFAGHAVCSDGALANLDVPIEAKPGFHLHFATTAARATQFSLTYESD